MWQLARCLTLANDVTVHGVLQARILEWVCRFLLQKISCLDSITDSMDMNLSKLQEILKDRGAWWASVHGSERVRHDLATEQQQ